MLSSPRDVRAARHRLARPHGRGLLPAALAPAAAADGDGARSLQGQLREGDEVLTTSGIYGRIVELGDDDAELEIAPGTVIRVARGAIGAAPDADPERRASTAPARPRRPAEPCAAQMIMLIVTVVVIVGTFVATLRLRQPSGARPRPPGRHLDRALPGEGLRPVHARHRGRHHPQPRRRPRHRRARGAAPGQHDRRRPARREGTRRRPRIRSARPPSCASGRCQAELAVGARRIAARRPRPVDGRRRPTTVTGAPTTHRRPVDGDHVDHDQRARGAGRAHDRRPRRSRRRARPQDDDRPARRPHRRRLPVRHRRPRPARRPATVAPPQPGQSCKRPCSRRATREPARRATVRQPGRPARRGDRTSCYVLGPTIAHRPQQRRPAERAYDSNTAS